MDKNAIGHVVVSTIDPPSVMGWRMAPSLKRDDLYMLTPVLENPAYPVLSPLLLMICRDKLSQWIVGIASL